jgi:hypothetical protein
MRNQKKSPMRMQKIVLLLISVASLAACAKKDGETAIGRDVVSMSPTVEWARSVGISANGTVSASASQQSLFQDGVEGYVDAMLPAEYLGFVSATATNGTGFFFGAKVALQTGVLNPSASSAQINIRPDSKLYTEIRDEYTDRLDSAGEKVPAIVRGFVTASGYVQGNRAYLKFTDKYGSVVMEGTFNATNFVGLFFYDNVLTAGTGPIAAGEVGQFEVPTCQFFRCQ